MSSLPPARKEFRPANAVTRAQFISGQPPFIRWRTARGRFAVGIKYENEVQEFLEFFVIGNTALKHVRGPWLEFTDDSGRRWCQPDALLVDEEKRTVTICEVKYQHTIDAWYQLRQLYLPVLRVAMAGYQFRLLEIVHWFDPATAWPERIVNVPGLESVGALACGEAVATLIFNKRREHRIQQARRGDSEGVGDQARPLWPAERSS